LEKCIIKGLKSERDNKIFRQILLCDNFLTFKKVMVTKNKELELEALTKIHQQASKEGIFPLLSQTLISSATGNRCKGTGETRDRKGHRYVSGRLGEDE
jgi:hypothetical protein